MATRNVASVKPAILPTAPVIKPVDMTTKRHDFLTYLIIVAVVIVVYYTLFATLGGMEDALNGTPKKIVEILLWTSFIILVLLNGISYIFQIDVINSLKGLFYKPTTTTTTTATATAPKLLSASTVSTTDTSKATPTIGYGSPQVFHIPGNKYSFDDSSAMCKAYGGRLANYMDLDAAFQKGADWCSYGWSDGQMALFPTQQEKWDLLQKEEGHENDCGHPGINGGFIGNPNVRFGVNCYGPKPLITPSDVLTMQNTPLFIKSRKERAFDESVDQWRQKLPGIGVAPFNHNQWNSI